MCGENLETEYLGWRRVGSSPRVRGKRAAECARHVITGLIPACAGKTKCCRWRMPRSPAHPRVCGENFDFASGIFEDCGSSPRVRGKPLLRLFSDGDSGLIPACAGKTEWCDRLTEQITAHPRVCGENLSVLCLGSNGRGSSPRVRGKRIPAFKQFAQWRLIPACAGKTTRSGKQTRLFPAHPRVCGENAF